ncbi:MAG: sodium:solute symporter [Ferruginibacter sp.]|nr:sodium:solute symporter [Ferruginibacter sp.]
MSTLDWIILVTILTGIIAYGVYKSRTTKNLDGYFLGNRTMPWYIILLGIMGTQASAITFLTGPGQAYSDGMRFVQYYFGLPLAMLVIAFVFVPTFSKLKITTAYEFLQNRFDVKTRTLTSLLFLVSRGLSTGISVYAPAIVLSTLFDWNIYITNIIMGGFLIIYTVSGGAKAVAHTQKIQMLLVFTTLGLIIYSVIKLLPDGQTVGEAIKKATGYGKMNTITTGFTENGFNWNDKYNIFSGIIGGFFLALSYFGTDHSQVGRYITAKSTKESKTGLLLNGLVKIPMQYIILMLGVFTFLFYISNKAPVYFDSVKQEKAYATSFKEELKNTEKNYEVLLATNQIEEANKSREEYKAIMKKALPNEDVSDTNFVFLRFAMDNLPKGLIGLFIAILFLSAWGSIAAALNSLAACSVVDFHQQFFKKDLTEEESYKTAKWYTLGWGLFCIVVAMFATNIGNSLIETVNILGSLFYGVILGIFLIAFFIKRIKANATFIAAIITELLVIGIYNLKVVSFLWLNVIGALLIILVAGILQLFIKEKGLK